jgi:hypothetical protein
MLVEFDADVNGGSLGLSTVLYRRYRESCTAVYSMYGPYFM